MKMKKQKTQFDVSELKKIHQNPLIVFEKDTTILKSSFCKIDNTLDEYQTQLKIFEETDKEITESKKTISTYSGCIEHNSNSKPSILLFLTLWLNIFSLLYFTFTLLWNPLFKKFQLTILESYNYIQTNSPTFYELIPPLNYNQQIALFIFICTLLFCPIIMLYKGEKQLIRKIKEDSNKRDYAKQNLFRIKTEYKKEIINILGTQESANIRDLIIKNYQTNNQELEYIIMNIINKYYPENSNKFISSNFSFYSSNEIPKGNHETLEIIHNEIENKIKDMIERNIEITSLKKMKEVKENIPTLFT